MTRGHPVSAAASIACIEVLQQENLVSASKSKEEIIRTYLQHESIVALRGQGMVFAAQFSDTDFNFKVIEACVGNGVITDWFLFNDKCLRIAPPLIITEDQLKWACQQIVKSIDEVRSQQ